MKAGWEVVPLGEVVRLNYGKAIPKEVRGSEGPVPVFGANGVMDYCETALAEGPSLIIGRKGSAGAINLASRPFWASDVTYFTDHDVHRIDFGFMHYLLRHLDLPSLAKGVKPGINREEVYGLPIPLPPLDEQKRIVAILDEAFEGLDRARANAEANLADARELYSNALEQSLLECGAPCSSLGAHVDQLVGYAFKSADFTENAAGIRLLRGDNIVPGGTRWEGAKYWGSDRIEGFEKYFLQPQDVLIAMDRTWIKAGIKFAVVTEQDVPSLLVQRVARLRVRPGILVDFLAALIRSRDFERYVLSIQTGTGVPHISGGQIEAFPVRVPPIEEQGKIMERLNVIQTAVVEITANIEASTADLATLRQSLLQKAFSGELT